MKNKSKLILASAVFIAALMLLVPLSQTDMSGGGGSENSTSDSVVLSANPTPDYYVSNGGEDGNNGTSEGASFKTITCAISAAINAGGGKVIKIADGTYEESLVINGNITLIGDDDPGNVIIKPSSASGSVISIGADNISLTVSGITLKTAAQELSNPTDDEELKGRGYGLTTGSYNSTVELSNVVIDGFTYGISSYGETGLTLTNSKIQNTTYKGIFAIKLASAEFTDVTFKNNATATALLPGENPNSRSGSAIDFNLTNACNHISFSRCTFDTNGDVNGSTSGAIKIKIRGGDNETESYAGSGSITNGVSISNCTFINNSRDVVLGTQQKPNSSDDFAVKYSGGSPIREYNFAETNSNATDGVKSSFFANGNKITIGVADSNSTIISWNSGSCTYSEDDAKKLAVFGGSKNADVSSSSIDMTGGKVACLYGGGYGDSSETPASVDTASIEITGGTIQVTVFGGGLGYANVDETTITISDAAISQDVVAGGASNSSAKDASGISTSVNTVTKATINISGGSVGNSATYGGVYGGGQSLAYVKSSEINVTGGSIYLLCASGSNGITGTTEMTISGDAKITYLFSVNRGVINNSEINIKSSFAGAIDKLALGALSDWDNNGQNYAQFKS